jgi:hypothetical protein
MHFSSKHTNETGPTTISMVVVVVVVGGDTTATLDALVFLMFT